MSALRRYDPCGRCGHPGDDDPRRLRADPDAHQMVSTALRTALRTEGLEAHARPVTDHGTMLAAAARHRPGV